MVLISERPWERFGTVAPFLLPSPHPGFLGWSLREWRQHGHGGGVPAVGPAGPPCALTPFEVSGATFLSWQLQSPCVSKGLWSFPRRKGNSAKSKAHDCFLTSVCYQWSAEFGSAAVDFTFNCFDFFLALKKRELLLVKYDCQNKLKKIQANSRAAQISVL